MFVIQWLIAFLGRCLIGIMFISMGIHQMLDWPTTEEALVRALNEWESLTVGVDLFQDILSYALISITPLITGAIICQVVGGLCILLGVQVRLGAFLLVLFFLPATVLFHHFWLVQGEEREMQMVKFMKNGSILGGLLLLLAYGKCKKSQQVGSAHSSDMH